MDDRISRQARRRFLKLATAGVAAAPFGAARLARLAHAQERVEEDEELAQQVGYKHDASDVDPNEWPDYEEGETCANCQLYHGEEGAELGSVRHFWRRAGLRKRLVLVLVGKGGLTALPCAPSCR